MEITRQELQKLLELVQPINLEDSHIYAVREQTNRLLRSMYVEGGLVHKQPLEIEEMHEIAHPDGKSYLHDQSHIYKPITQNINTIHRRYEQQYGKCAGPITAKNHKGQDTQVGYVYTRREVVNDKPRKHSVFVHFIRRVYEDTFLWDIENNKPIIYQKE